MWTAKEYYLCTSGSARQARMFCTEKLSSLLGSTSEAQDVVDTVELIVSELITNAVNASCSRTTLSLSCEGGSLRIDVLDDGPGRPQLTRATDRDVHGRGLAIVETLARSWGVDADSEHGKRVWAEVELPPELLAS